MGSIKGGSIGEMYLQIDYTINQNASNNTSTVRATLKLVNHYALYMTTMGGSYLSVGGQKVDYKTTIDYGDSTATKTTTLYGPKDFIISHNSDGTASCNLTGTFVMNGVYRGYSVGTMTVSQTITLPKIARSSSFTVSSSVNTGSAISGTVTPSYPAFNHKILLKVGTETKATITMPVGTTTFSQKIDHNWFPSSTSGTISAVLETYNGTTLVATTSKNITANVPSNIAPVITSVTTTVVNGQSGRYVEGKSKVLITVNATKGDGATDIVNYAFSGPNINTNDGSSYMSIDSNATTYYQTSALLKYAGGGTYSVTVTDTRGRKATTTLTDAILVHWYGAPTISTLAAQRCNADGMINENGKYAKVVVFSNYAPIDGVNKRTVVLSNSSDNYSTKTTMQSTTDTNTAYSYIYGGSFDVNKTYTIRATITDTSYNASSTAEVELSAAKRTVNILSDGTGIGVGKVAETSGLLDVAWDTRVRGNLSVDGTFNHFGIGGEAKLVSGNWNTACGNITGFFRGYQLTNSPNVYTVDGWWYVHQIVHDSNYKIQLAYSYNDSRGAYKRLYNNGTWSEWRQFIFDNSFEGFLAQNGYTRLPNGLFIQWGVLVSPANQYLTSITFPIAFPNYARSVTCQHNWDDARNIAYSISNVSTSGFNVHPYFTDSNATPSVNCVAYWMAIGH